MSRMLVGGIKVIGVYIWASENAFKNSTGVLCQVSCIINLSAVFLDCSLSVI